jgi:hypothetical protein
MKFFIDTADIKEIREAAAMGLVDGVTTNPSLVAKTGRKFRDVLLEICDIVKGPVSAEVVGTTYDVMMKEARELAGPVPAPWRCCPHCRLKGDRAVGTRSPPRPARPRQTLGHHERSLADACTTACAEHALRLRLLETRSRMPLRG